MVMFWLLTKLIPVLRSSIVNQLAVLSAFRLTFTHRLRILFTYTGLCSAIDVRISPRIDLLQSLSSVMWIKAQCSLTNVEWFYTTVNAAITITVPLFNASENRKFNKCLRAQFKRQYLYIYWSAENCGIKKNTNATFKSMSNTSDEVKLLVKT